MTLILRKLLASSTYEISGTLDGLAKKLESAAASAEAVDAPPEELPDNLEEFNELADEWEEDSELPADRPDLTPDQLTEPTTKRSFNHLNLRGKRHSAAEPEALRYHRDRGTERVELCAKRPLFC